MKTATICYIEIPAPDVEKAGAFYSTVFGWKITPSDLTARSYWMFSTGENQLMGGLTPDLRVQEAGVILYIKVDDILEKLKLIEKEGGLVVKGKSDIGGGYGYSAIFADPNGNQLGLWASQ